MCYFPEVPLGNKNMAVIAKLHGFYDICQAFIHSLLGWKSSDEGLFGEVNAYLGNITHNKMEGLKFQALVWINQPDSLASFSLDTKTLIRRGGVSEAAQLTQVFNS